MLKTNFAAYLGKEKPEGFSGFIAENNLFLIIEIETGVEAQQIREILQKIRDESSNLSIDKLAAFDHFISGIITRYNFPSSSSLVAGYLNNDIFYLKTVGQGRIYLQREGNFAEIIENDNSASGRIRPDDFFVFTTSTLIELLGSDLELKTIFDHKDPHGIVEDLTPQLKAKDDEGAIALLIQFKQDEVEATDINQPVVEDKINQFEQVKGYFRGLGKRKSVTLVVVAVILLFLIWSIGLNYLKGNESQANKKIKSTKELVNKKLKEAEENSFLNLSGSLTLISEAKKEVAELKKQLGNKKEKEIIELEQLIKEKESKIVKKEEKKFEEFYDLTLDNKEAKGTRLYLDNDRLNIIDKGKGLIYQLSLSKKSLDKKSSSEIKQADLVSSYQDNVLFFVKGAGVFKISADAKAKKVIENDKDWGDIVGMWIYNGNIYLLDSVKGDIYKYLVTEGGYSEKSSYLGGNAGSVKEGNSLAIDSSVYVGLSDEILKFTAGNKEDFATSWPEKNVKITKIFTSADVEKVYAWDKGKGAIYILGKKGNYERQINSDILSKATDFVVFKDAAHVLFGEKIYKILLD